MKILAIETSCDETSAAVVESLADNQGVKILSNIVASSMNLHSKTGGIIPEVAAREQSKFIIPVISEALTKAGLRHSGERRSDSRIKDGSWTSQDDVPDIDAIAVTYGPGLIGSLLVGVETAKTLSYIWNKPLIPINHLFGHIYANWLKQSSVIPAKAGIHKDNKEGIPDQVRDDELIVPQFPLIALIVSGGHTDLLLMKSHIDITWLGGTRDDAAGECFDKSGRLLGFSYPAGPEIEKKAKLGNPKTYHFPRPLLHDNAYDFSFSGLKTAILREVERLQRQPLTVKGKDKSSTELNASRLPLTAINDLCRGLQDAINDVLITKTLDAAKQFNVKSILLSGGVAANTALTEQMKQYAIRHMPYAKIFVPQKFLCTDNAAMIGAAALFQGEKTPWQDVSANPELYFD